MTYREGPTAVPGVVLWSREADSVATGTRILPDGCLDVLWDGVCLLVAGPDTRARWHDSPTPTSYVALRLSAGTGPALLGVPAAELRDRTVRLEDLWPSGVVRRLTEHVASGPVEALQAWARDRAHACPTDPLGPDLLALASVGLPVAAMAARLGLSTRQLDRRSLALFGYGPRHLTRVLRLGRALDDARRGTPLSRVAIDAGYADQAHFSRDTSDLAGTSPTRLLSERRLAV